MKERPIIFSSGMVRATLEGRKTMTRRPCKDQTPIKYWYGKNLKMIPDGKETYTGWVKDIKGIAIGIPSKCPYGQPGDWFWVKETWWKSPNITPKDLKEGAGTWPNIFYDADPSIYQEQIKEWGWIKKPSIFMPHGNSRITLEITNIRVERLQEITTKDILKEGYPVPIVSEYSTETQNPKNWFKNFWNSIYGKDSWNQNPWVWVIEFKRIKK